MRTFFQITLLLAILVVGGCGQKGPLYLPPEDVSPPTEEDDDNA